MTSVKVIQGSFLVGQPKLAGSSEPRIAMSPPVQSKTTMRPQVPAFAARPVGAPTPAVAGPPGAVQRHGAGGAFPVEAARLGLASGGGRPLPETVRGKMEAALGADFSNVRVHIGPQAERIGAIAFTMGSDIYFAPGRYQPNTPHGQQLIGHELAHVVQQRAGRVRNPSGTGLAVVQDQALEAEADRLGQRAAAHRVAAQAKIPSGAAQPSSSVRISPPIAAGPSSYRLSAGAGGREIGSVMIHARNRGAVEITNLGVDATQRGQGVGQMLVAAAARAGLQSGKSKVTLIAQDSGSGRLTQWYKGMGFTQTGVNQRGYPQLEAAISRVMAATVQRREAKFVGPPLSRVATAPGEEPKLAIQRAGTAPQKPASLASSRFSSTAVKSLNKLNSKPRRAHRIAGLTSFDRAICHAEPAASRRKPPAFYRSAGLRSFIQRMEAAEAEAWYCQNCGALISPDELSSVYDTGCPNCKNSTYFDTQPPPPKDQPHVREIITDPYAEAVALADGTIINFPALTRVCDQLTFNVEVTSKVWRKMRQELSAAITMPNKSHPAHGTNFDKNQRPEVQIKDWAKPISGELKRKLWDFFHDKYNFDLD